jgi:hypothetical protein
VVAVAKATELLLKYGSSDTESSKERVAVEFQRVTGTETVRSRGCRHNKGHEELKRRNFRPWMLEEFQESARGPRVSNTLGLRTLATVKGWGSQHPKA